MRPSVRQSPGKTSASRIRTPCMKTPFFESRSRTTSTSALLKKLTVRMADPRVGQPHVVLFVPAEDGGQAPQKTSRLAGSSDRESSIPGEACPRTLPRLPALHLRSGLGNRSWLFPSLACHHRPAQADSYYAAGGSPPEEFSQAVAELSILLSYEWSRKYNSMVR